MPTFSPELNTLLMFGSLFFFLFLGFPLAFVLTGVGLLFGVSLFGINFAGAFYPCIFIDNEKLRLVSNTPFCVYGGNNAIFRRQ